MYVQPNFKTKKALKEAVAKGDIITIFQPNQMSFHGPTPTDGKVTVEGPQPHTWYAQVLVKDGCIIAVK